MGSGQGGNHHINSVAETPTWCTIVFTKLLLIAIAQGQNLLCMCEGSEFDPNSDWVRLGKIPQVYVKPKLYIYIYIKYMYIYNLYYI